MAMGWGNWLEEVEVVLICVLNQVAEVALRNMIGQTLGAEARKD